ncbi:MAG: hypothetical protein CMH84_06490 [Nocardioides sp.]|nr:hypothetical protein [Nocardioides sp.]
MNVSGCEVELSRNRFTRPEALVSQANGALTPRSRLRLGPGSTWPPQREDTPASPRPVSSLVAVVAALGSVATDLGAGLLWSLLAGS